MINYIISPGYTNSGPDHWQTHIETRLTNVVRVSQRDWLNVQREQWIDGVQRAVSAVPAEDPVILIGHSCGSNAIAQWAVENPDNAHISHIILVAPADCISADVPPAIRGQGRLPDCPLPYPTTLVRSDEDPFLPDPIGKKLSSSWRVVAEHVVHGGGHLATSDGYGRWPWMEQLISSITRDASQIGTIKYG